MRRNEFLHLAGLAALAGFKPLPLAASPEEPMKAYRLAIDHGLPDPFCTKYGSGYYITGTSHTTSRRTGGDLLYDMYYSVDLKKWESVGPLLKRPEYEGSHQANYWAPEILQRGDKFYLYYTADSFGDPYRRFVRVAEGSRIEGPYEDAGKLVEQPSIDGHPVFDEEAGWLFYTGNEGNEFEAQMIVDRFVNPTQLAGKPRKVFPDEKVPWEEGGFTFPNGGKQYLFTSMGNWRDGSYHVLVARSYSLNGPFVRLTKGGSLLKLLVTKGEQFGPGHNSVFSGPEGRSWICYHAWDEAHTGRYPWVAPIYWQDGLPLVHQV